MKDIQLEKDGDKWLVWYQDGFTEFDSHAEAVEFAQSL